MENKLSKVNDQKREIDKLSWEDMYELTKTYYEYYGELTTDPNFKTINGYEEDESGVNLSKWIENQRQKIRSKSMINFFIATTKIDDKEKDRLEGLKQLTDDQVLSLVCIGFRTDTFQDNHNKVKDLLIKNGITNTAIIFSLRMRSFTEICAIIDYLTSNNIPLEQNGKLNEIFYMNGIQMKESYGFYKHELITSYMSKQTKDIKKKQLV